MCERARIAAKDAGVESVTSAQTLSERPVVDIHHADNTQGNNTLIILMEALPWPPYLTLPIQGWRLPPAGWIVLSESIDKAVLA